MATGNDYNVSLGTWAIETKGMDSDYRLTTYADLVAKTISMSSEVLYQLGGESNINNIYVLDGRKTLPYQQLTHSDSVSVWLKPSEASLHKYMYRFNGEPGQLPKFTCDEQDPYGNNYSLEQCVNPSDITPVAPDKTIRFRFKNITFPPYIELVDPSIDGYCTEVEINSENNHDLTDPHDVYVKMKNGRKARFIVGPYTTLTPSENVYHGDPNYYPGNVNEYQPSFDGSVWLTYTKYDDTETASLTSGYVTSPAIDVEPYQHQAYVTMLGKRNTPVYIQVEADGHIGVRQVLDNVPQSYSEVDDGSHGRTVVLPPDHMAYYNTTISNPGNSLISLKSQNDDEWDSYNAVVINLKTGTIIKTVDNSIFSTDFLISLEKLQKGNQYAVQLTSIPKFHSVTVRITDYVNLDIDYLPNFDPSKTYDYTQAIPSSLTLVAGKWIHEFQTVEQTTVASNHIGIRCKVTEDTTDYENIGHNKKKSLLKLSQSTDQNPAIQTFSGDGKNASVSISYVHSQTRLPRIMNLYVRVLENVKINFRIPEGFYIRDKNQQWQTGTPYEDNPKYNQIELELDPERDVDFNQRRVTFHIQRRANGEYNSLNGRFYYNDSWSGGNDTTVRFDGIPSGIIPVDDTEPYTTYDININNITFGVTNFSVVLVGTARSAMTINFHLPEFVSIASNNLMFPNTESILPDHLGAYIGLATVDETLDGKALIWQNYSTSIESDAGRPSSWSGGTESGELKTAYNYSFNTTGNDINIVLKGISSRDGFYLPTWLYKKLNIRGSSEHWDSLTSEYTLTNNEYQLLNMGSAMSPAISGLLKSGVDNPVMDITAVSWGNPTIFIAMEIVSIESEDAYMTEPKLILLNSELTLVDLNVAHIDAMALNDIRVHNPDSTNNVYKLLLPEYYRNSYPDFKGFNMYMTPHQDGENHLEEIESYEVRCYIPYDNANEFSVVRDIVPTDRLITGDLLGSSFPYGISASYMDKDALIIIKPKAGEAKMQIVCMKYLDINGSPLTTDAFSDMQIYPDNSNTVVSLYIKCRQSNANIDFEVDSEKTPGGDANLSFSVTNLQGTAPNGSTYTHLVEIDLDDNMWDYNQNAAVSDFKYYGNQHIYFKLIYKKGTQEERTKKFDFRVCPVVKIWCLPISGNYMKNDAGTTHKYKLCVEEYYNNNGTVTTRYLNNGEALYYFMTLGVNLTWQYRQTSSTTNEFSTYFEEPVFNATNGEYTFKIKESLNAPESGKLYCTASITGQTSTWPQITSEVNVANMVTARRIDWWDGANYQSAGKYFENALLSPVPYNINSELRDTVGVYLKFKDNHGLNLNSANAHLENSDYDDCLGVNVSHNVTLDGVTYDLRIGIKTKCAIGQYNDDLVSRLFYTGQTIGFELDINYTSGGVYTYPFDIKLGPVISFAHEVATGRFADYPGYPTGEYFEGRLKAEVGQKIVTQSRAHEWFSDGSTIEMTGNHIVGLQSASDRTVRGRRYDIVWKYNGTELTENTGTMENVPQAELLSGESVYAFTREFKNTYLKVQHAAAWTGYNGSRYNPGTGDGGAWRVEVINMNSQFTSGNLTAQVTITDINPEISMHHWYDGGKTTVLPVANEISIVKWTVYNMGSYPPVLENSDLLYTMTTGGRDALVLYLRVQDTSASVNVTSKLQSNGFMAIRQTEVVSGEAWNKVIYMVNTSAFFAHNSSLTNTSQRVVSNEQITFTISYTSSTVTTSINHTMHIGPVADNIEILNQSEEFLPDYQGTEIKYQIRVPEWKNTSNYQYYTIGNQTFNVDVVEQLSGKWHDANEYSISDYFVSSGPDEGGIYTKIRNSRTMPESMYLNVSPRHQIGLVRYPSTTKSFDVEVVGYLNFYSNEGGLNNTKWFLCTSSMMFTYQNVSQYYTFDLEFINNYHYASFLVLYDGSDVYIRRIRSDGSFDQGNISIIAGYIRPEYAYDGDEPSGFAFSWSNEFADCSGPEWATGTSTVITKYEVTQHVPVPGRQDEVNQYQTHFSQIAGITSRSSVSWCLDGEEQHLPSSSALDKYPFFDPRYPIWN